MARPVIKNVLGSCVATVPPPKPVVLLVLVWPLVEEDEEGMFVFYFAKKRIDEAKQKTSECIDWSVSRSAACGDKKDERKEARVVELLVGVAALVVGRSVVSGYGGKLT